MLSYGADKAKKYVNDADTVDSKGLKLGLSRLLAKSKDYLKMEATGYFDFLFGDTMKRRSYIMFFSSIRLTQFQKKNGHNEFT